jgi:hypothetical protein
MRIMKRRFSVIAIALAIGYVFANTHRDRGVVTDRLRYNTEGPAT